MRRAMRPLRPPAPESVARATLSGTALSPHSRFTAAGAARQTRKRSALEGANDAGPPSTELCAPPVAQAQPQCSTRHVHT